jgi:hypothetical protein
MSYFEEIYSSEQLHLLIKSGVITKSFWVNSTNVNMLNGVKEIREVTFLNQMFVEETIQDGVKEIGVISNISLMSEIFKVNANRAIRDGVKELKELPDKSGEFRGYGDYYRKQKDMTKPHTEYVKEVIEDSYNHMGRVEGVIRNTDKDGI